MDATFDSNDVYNRGFTELVFRRERGARIWHTYQAHGKVYHLHDVHLRKLKELRKQLFNIDNYQPICLKLRSKRRKTSALISSHHSDRSDLLELIITACAFSNRNAPQ